MKTEKLYDADAYCRDFTARVLACTPCERGYDIVLDRTAFFPTEGGQYADHGTLGTASITDVQITDDILHHISDQPLAVGRETEGHIFFEERFEKMQCHTAEHIVSGLLFSRFGAHNRGFHLGERDVTLDVDIPLSRAELDETETLACEAVFCNLPVIARYPSARELAGMQYRCKLELTQNVRIVEIPGYDVCACCAPHVRTTGEIGIIKLLDFEKHKGGVRVFLSAGARALRDYREKYENVRAVSALLSVRQSEAAQAVKKLRADTAATDAALRALRVHTREEAAKCLCLTPGNRTVFLEPGVPYDELRAFANAGAPACGGVLVVLSQKNDAFRYVACCTHDIGIGSVMRRAHAVLCGQGGAKGTMAQGIFTAAREAIETFFAGECEPA